jgi:large subunit ribosomal protein L15e
LFSFIGYIIYRARVRRGNRKKPVPKGATYGKPKNQGVNHIKPTRSLQSVAEERVGRRCGGLRVLNSYWVGQDAVYKYYEVILCFKLVIVIILLFCYYRL